MLFTISECICALSTIIHRFIGNTKKIIKQEITIRKTPCQLHSLLNKSKNQCMKMTGILMTFMLLFTGASFSQTAKSEFGKEFLPFWEVAKNQALELAEIIPEEKYAYIPAEGGRSVAQMFLHIAYAHHFMKRRFVDGIKMNYDSYEKRNGLSKKEIIDLMKQSFEDVKQTLLTITEEELKQRVNAFGNNLSKKQMFYYLSDHNTSHTGKLKLIVRLLGMKPPAYRFLDH